MMGTVHWIVVDVPRVSTFSRFVGCSGGAGPAWEYSEVYLVPCISDEYMCLTHPLNQVSQILGLRNNF